MSRYPQMVRRDAVCGIGLRRGEREPWSRFLRSRAPVLLTDQFREAVNCHINSRVTQMVFV